MPEASESAPIQFPLLRKTWQRAMFILALVVAAAAFLATLCLRDPHINFLSRDGRAEWIRFPTPLDPRAHVIANLDTIFRREFALEHEARSAQLNVRAAKRGELRINGLLVDLGDSRNWKNFSSVNVGSFLRAGTNTIEARILNENGPPALWLTLDTDTAHVRTDQSWEASFAGSSWRPAILASAIKKPGPGNVIAGGETTVGALAKVWPIWLMFAVIAVAICFIGGRWFQKSTSDDAKEMSRRHTTTLLLILAGLWVILYWNNAASLREDEGFDTEAHYDYIRFVQEQKALPLPTQGYEMFQPPLYYVLSAGVLSLCRISIRDSSAVTVLRGLTILLGIANFVLVFLCLRLCLPRRIGAQLVGLTLAAFLPMQLYLSHYLTNETLAAALISAAVYFALRVLRGNGAGLWEYVCLGLCMGAAMLTKATGLLLLPAVVAALLFKLAVEQREIAMGLRNMSILLAVCLAVCGWHYLRIWAQFGTPLLGNWDIASGFAWWQDPGYHMAGDYLRFGRSLVDPLFSGFAGLFDGIYSTLWGDALCGGRTEMALRPPWNYNLVVAGYLLTTIPTILILIGAVAAIHRFVRNPTPDWILLFVLSGSVALGLIFMTLRVPSYAQIKAFYGLSALVPLGLFAAIGWETVTRRRTRILFALAIPLLIWATNSFASVWIHDPASRHVRDGLRLRQQKQIDAAIAEGRRAVDAGSTHPAARRFLAVVLNESGRTDEALELAESGVRLTPLDSACYVQLGTVLLKRNELDRATAEGRHALKLGPENPAAYELLFSCFRKSGRDAEAINIARDGLAVSPYDADFHHRLGLLLAQKTNYMGAINHFAYAMMLGPDPSESESKLRIALGLLTKTQDGVKQLQEVASAIPDSPRALNHLAWLFATHPDMRLRNGKEAVRLAERASASSDRKTKPAFLATLAAAYAEAGRFPDAIKCAQKASSLAESSGDAGVVALCQKLLTSFHANTPYRDDSPDR
jgi:tetratricopeptide (TPR) repeat protein